MTKYFFLLALTTTLFNINAQNFVPNGGFEEFTECPKKFSDFVYIKGWNNLANNSTPDLFSTCASIYSVVHPKSRWCQVDAVKDSTFAGIIVQTHKSNYREYIGTKLHQPLKKDSTYLFQISIATPKLSRWSIDTLGILFTKKIVYNTFNAQAIVFPAQILIPLDSLKSDGTWFDFSVEYKATGNENYINIGNFLSIDDTETKKIGKRNDKKYRKEYNFAYLCVDNILITPLKANQPKIKKPPISKNETIEQDSITLNDIQFKTDSWQLQQKEIPELNSLVEYLLSNSDKNIIVEGHTDNTGTLSNNQELSLKRAERIAQYLSEKGIEISRVSVVGYASEKPVSNNETSEGRKKNRRVVVRVE